MPPRTPADPLVTLWEPRALIWAVFLVLGLALVMTLAPGQPAAPASVRMTYFGLVAFAGTWVALLTLGGLYVLRHRLAGMHPLQLSWLGFVLLLVSTWVVCIAAVLLARLLLGQVALWEWLLRATAVATTVGVLALGAFQTYWQNRQLQARVRISELAALQARTNPHFLFNALNTAVALARRDPEEVEGLLLDLGDLFRAALAAPQEVPLAEELDLTRKYLAIEAARFGERLRVDWELPEPLPEVPVPRLCVQPLAENAVLHGIERSGSGGTVRIGVAVEDGWLRVGVANQLPPAAAAPRKGHSIGLDGVRQRVEELTGGRGRVETVVEAGWHRAEVWVPVRDGAAR